MRKCLSAVLAGVVSATAAYATPSVEVVTRDDFELIPLNPLRGDASPKAGVLWGNLREDVATGALIQFADGFSSPPHIHNITYRAVVIDGVVHNDDPTAAMFWMEPGSFWTQPAGETHITALGPGGGLAFLEIESGPYLVRPSEEAFDNGERPINNEARNIIWLTAADTTWITGDAGTEMAFLWGDHTEGSRNGSFVRVQPGAEARLDTGGTPLRLVLAKGELTHTAQDLSAAQNLTAGSYVGSEGEVFHDMTCTGTDPCLVYVSATGTYRVSD